MSRVGGPPPARSSRRVEAGGAPASAPRAAARSSSSACPAASTRPRSRRARAADLREPLERRLRRSAALRPREAIVAVGVARSNAIRDSGESQLCRSPPTRSRPGGARGSARRTRAAGPRRAPRARYCAAVGLVVRRPRGRRRSRARPRVGVVEVDRSARPPGSSPAPTGTGSRRSGTRGPCCGGSSAPGRRRRRTRAAECSSSLPPSRVGVRDPLTQPPGQRRGAELLGDRRRVQQLARRARGRSARRSPPAMRSSRRGQLLAAARSPPRARRRPGAAAARAQPCSRRCSCLEIGPRRRSAIALGVPAEERRQRRATRARGE